MLKIKLKKNNQLLKKMRPKIKTSFSVLILKDKFEEYNLK